MPGGLDHLLGTRLLSWLHFIMTSEAATPLYPKSLVIKRGSVGLMLLFLSVTPAVLSQAQFPSLEQTRLAAEKGDPAAQHKFAEVFLSKGDYSTAFKWFQKAAAQGVVDSQYRLGQMLLDGKPKVPKDSDEAIKWLLLTANQGHQLAQLDLAQCYESGKAVNRDIVEAYKWYKLISHTGMVDMNRLVLGMTHEQIQEGEQRAKDWKPHKMTDEELLEAIYLKKMLKAIAGSAGRRLAIINGRPFETGEQAKVKVGQKMVTVRCLEIKEKSAVVQIEGIGKPKEINLQ